MRIAVGSDHAGYKLKEEIVRFLANEGIDLKDFGVHTNDPADYPDIGIKVAEAVANGEFDCGILICATGVGMSIAANKVPGIRAALCANVDCAVLSRKHNDANVLVLGARVLDDANAVEITKTWLAGEFSGEKRHLNRIMKIAQIEKKYNGSGG